MNRILILFAASMLFGSGAAFAQCITPAATEGEIVYNTDYGVHQYCNGTAWVAFGALNPGAGGSGCNVPTGIAGDLMYNSAYHVLQYCDGDDWRAVGGTVVTSSGLFGPADCPEIGDKCTTSGNDIIFAGWNPITHERLFIPPTDQGTLIPWKTSSGMDDIDPDSYDDGRLNHANRLGLIADFPAFKVCEDFVFGGKSDWYLPSRVELYYLWSVQAALEQKGNITPFISGSYWSSSEHTVSGARSQSFPGGSQDNSSKATKMFEVRCLWRP